MGRNIKDQTYLSLTLLVLRGLEALHANQQNTAVSAAQVRAWLVSKWVGCYSTKYVYNALWHLSRECARNSFGRKCRPAFVDVQRRQLGGVTRVTFWLNEKGRNVVEEARLILIDDIVPPRP